MKSDLNISQYEVIELNEKEKKETLGGGLFALLAAAFAVVSAVAFLIDALWGESTASTSSTNQYSCI